MKRLLAWLKDRKTCRYQQEQVMKGYRRRGAVKDKDEEWQLHMFFSPNRVPKGLTNAEVALCLSASGIREGQQKVPKHGFGERVLYPQGFTLPKLLREGPMTRANFTQGFGEFLRSVSPSGTV
jgi:hypothetical protein